MIVCVAVVGHQNNPLYIQSFTEADDALKLHHIVHCSLDVVDERVNNPKKAGPTLNETFLGLLYPTENYKVYGYLTNTKVKFILVTTDLDVKDGDMRNFFRQFHSVYVDAVSNPFHVPEPVQLIYFFKETDPWGAHLSFRQHVRAVMLLSTLKANIFLCLVPPFRVYDIYQSTRHWNWRTYRSSTILYYPMDWEILMKKLFLLNFDTGYINGACNFTTS
ncbi:unnamed protein product [Rhodiola kirilowii]